MLVVISKLGSWRYALAALVLLLCGGLLALWGWRLPLADTHRALLFTVRDRHSHPHRYANRSAVHYQQRLHQQQRSNAGGHGDTPFQPVGLPAIEVLPWACRHYATPL